MPPPPASGDLYSHPELSAWRSLHMSTMPIFMFHYVYAVTYEVAVQFDDAGHCAVYVYQV